MLLSTFNTNSIRARLPIITNWLDKIQPDVLCLQETKVQDRDFPANEFQDMGYYSIFFGQKSYNGVAILSKTPLYETRRGLYGRDYEEARLISARIATISVINVYVPQGFAPGTEKFGYKLKWLADLFSFIKNEYDSNMPILLAGDLNVALETIDVFDPDALRGEVGFHPDEQALIRNLLDWGLVDVFRKHEPGGGHYTFWDYRIPRAFKRKMGWRIDYILATAPLAERSTAAWIDTGPRVLDRPSDHTFLMAEFNLNS